MKPLYSYALIAALAAIGQASAAVEATTTPVGYVSIANNGTLAANTDATVSVPLLRAAEFTGTVSLVGDNNIGITGAAFTPSQFAGAEPYVAVVESGNLSGLVALITANATDFITVSVPSGDSIDGLLEGSKISIRKAWTVRNLLGTDKPISTQFLGFSGTAAGVNLGADLIYEWDGANWVDGIFGGPVNNNVIYPSETFILRNQTNAPISGLQVAGEVLKGNSRTVLSNSPGTGQDNLVSYFGAVGETIGASSLGAVAQLGDQVLAFDNTATGQNKGASVIVEFDGTKWVDGIFGDVVNDTFKFESGQGYIVRRAPTSSQSPVVWADVPAYVPSL